MKKPKTKNFAIEKTLGLQSLAISFVVIFGAWAYGAQKVDNALILPTLSQVVSKMGDIFESPTFWQVIKGSMRHILMGFGAAFALGTVAGFLSGLLKPFTFFFYPWIHLLRATPVMSIILYLILFLDSTQVAMSVSFLIVFPIIYTNILTGFKQVDANLLEMAKLYQVPFWRQFYRIYLPAIFPYMMAALITGMGINIKAVITAEALSIPQYAIGSELLAARNYLDTEGILAWTVVVILLAVSLDILLILFRFVVTKGHRSYVIWRRKSSFRV